MASTSKSKTYIVEHLDLELGDWSSLEYEAIARECHASGSKFLLSSVPHDLKLPANLKDLSNLNVEHRGVEEIYAESKSIVCLLDPAAKDELSPQDRDKFGVFLFGGILGRFHG